MHNTNNIIVIEDASCRLTQHMHLHYITLQQRLQAARFQVT